MVSSSLSFLLRWIIMIFDVLVAIAQVFLCDLDVSLAEWLEYCSFSVQHVGTSLRTWSFFAGIELCVCFGMCKCCTVVQWRKLTSIPLYCRQIKQYIFLQSVNVCRTAIVCFVVGRWDWTACAECSIHCGVAQHVTMWLSCTLLMHAKILIQHHYRGLCSSVLCFRVVFLYLSCRIYRVFKFSCWQR